MNGVMNGGWATLKTMRDELLEFKKSKKFIYAYSELYTEKTYYLATTADKIYMPNSGMMELNGLASMPMFYTGMFEKLDITPKIFRVGTFKSAVEPYFLKEMSEANKLQAQEYLGDIWNVFAEDVAAARKISKDDLDNITTNFVFGDGAQALANKLIDEVAYEDIVRAKLLELSGLSKDEKIRLVSLKKYMKTLNTDNKDSKNKIAVVFAEGEIQSGKSGDGTMGSETIVAALRKAREDENIKAVVLRVNSPGGSALASDIITREIELTRNVKPVIASMGDVAASGGYYISAKCDQIFADKNTITGSIGIFGLMFNSQKFFNNKLGITFDEVKTHENADFMNPNYTAPEFQDNLMQKYVERGYGNFLKVVKEGRNFPDSLSVDKIAQGRVWSGADAKDIKLIDEYGNLYAAIQRAAEKANLDKKDFKIKLFPESKSRFEDLLNKTTEMMMKQAKSQEPLQEEMEILRTIKRKTPKSGVYMLMPMDLDIH
jgi:protease IV